ncbi:S8 family serine peptidase [Rhizobium laguerreae]|uniref:S8 family serine peptidase n=1 Tax=Rhizobium laguerreae TaxID=1076926 RepID=UPI001C927D81|nr:S8 family serine peptidase [Rhizobium laguerreae]
MARRPSKRDQDNNGDDPESGGSPPASPPELIVVTHVESAMRASAGRFSAMSGAPTDTLATLLADHSATMRPLFGPTEERVAAFSSLSIGMAAIIEPTDLTTFYAIDAPTERLDSLQSDLLAHDLVDGAYIKPGAEPAAYLNDMAPTPEEAPPATPDYVSRQGYLEAAPGGVEARWAWTQAGGRGNGIRIIDIEGAWRFTHEDLTGNQGGVVGGTMSTDIGWRNHGTAVLGEFSGDLNSFGVAGIASDAVVSAISIFGGPGSAGAINAAAARLGAGDVILIELHRPGPRFAFANRGDQRGYIAVEWWPDDFAAIRNAVNRGIIVVEAGGNGAENLDDPIYQTPAAGFPAGWTNPFRRSNRDSGAIVVGAGAPPPGTHGRTHGADRSRLDFSNFGALFDTQGWGREVTTAGYGDLQGGGNEDLWYTDTFSGTSSASPIIVGVAASLQGMARARGHAVLTPAEFRTCLRSTGSPQR